MDAGAAAAMAGLPAVHGFVLRAAGFGRAEALAARADSEIEALLEKALSAATELIRNEREVVQYIAEELMRRTELSGREIQLLLEGKTLPPQADVYTVT